jgi:hypothetical protein
MTVRVVGAGLGRTGTSSLKIALERLLGGPCYHMAEVGQRPDDPDVWAAAYDGDLPDWSSFLADYRAVVDWPAAPFWAELADAYDDAVILLSERDPESWWTSASNTIFQAVDRYFQPDADDNGWTHMMRRMLPSFTPDWRDESAAKAAYVAHNEHVKATAPPDRLVVWTTGEGWEPICDALGLAVPDEPFPHVNSTVEAREMMGLD